MTTITHQLPRLRTESQRLEEANATRARLGMPLLADLSGRLAPRTDAEAERARAAAPVPAPATELVDGPDVAAATDEEIAVAEAGRAYRARCAQAGVVLSATEAIAAVTGVEDLDDPRVRARMARLEMAEQLVSGSDACARVDARLAADRPRREAVLRLPATGFESLRALLASDGRTAVGDATREIAAAVRRRNARVDALEETRAASARADLEHAHVQDIVRRAEKYRTEMAAIGIRVTASAAVAHVEAESR
jgi:hypothetical protein